jgi:chromosome segregation ATPase
VATSPGTSPDAALALLERLERKIDAALREINGRSNEPGINTRLYTMEREFAELHAQAKEYKAEIDKVREEIQSAPDEDLAHRVHTLMEDQARRDTEQEDRLKKIEDTLAEYQRIVGVVKWIAGGGGTAGGVALLDAIRSWMGASGN